MEYDRGYRKGKERFFDTSFVQNFTDWNDDPQP